MPRVSTVLHLEELLSLLTEDWNNKSSEIKNRLSGCFFWNRHSHWATATKWHLIRFPATIWFFWKFQHILTMTARWHGPPRNHCEPTAMTRYTTNQSVTTAAAMFLQRIKCFSDIPATCSRENVIHYWPDLCIHSHLTNTWLKKITSDSTGYRLQTERTPLKLL